MWFYYQQDLRDLWRSDGGTSRLTWRLLGVWIRRLPPESATKTALRDELGDDELARLAKEKGDSGHGPWSSQNHLLAGIADRLGAIHAAVYRAQGAKVDYPDPWPRPGVKTSRRRRLTPKGREYLQRLVAQHNALAAAEEPAAEG